MNMINNETIKLLESFIGCGLPKTYKELLICNFEQVKSFNFKVDKNEYQVNSFFKINSKLDDDWVYHYKLFLNRIPKDCIAIGEDICGNLILLGLKGKNREKIYYWDHEFEVDDGQVPDYSNIELVSENLIKNGKIILEPNGLRI